jgi:hypothetical protein
MALNGLTRSPIDWRDLTKPLAFAANWGCHEAFEMKFGRPNHRRASWQSIQENENNARHLSLFTDLTHRLSEIEGARQIESIENWLLRWGSRCL